SPTSIQKNDNVNVVDNNKVVMTVGKESIYQSDLDREVNLFPKEAKINLNYIKQKVASDSVILQGGEEEGYIVLNKNIFNNKNISYGDRYKAVEMIKTKVSSQSARARGTVYSIFFYNEWLGPLGYEGSKNFALEKLTKIHNDIKLGVITVEQAKTILKTDDSISQVDKNWKGNAIIEFDSEKSKAITFSKEINDVIWKTPLNIPSNLILVKDWQVDPSNPIKNLGDEEVRPKVYVDAMYSFVIVESRINETSVGGFQEWLQLKSKKYEIQYN
ncbi:MAG: hypothetical protein WCO06_00730, partial [Candidatus Roizmanbacteria bacterium]